MRFLAHTGALAVLLSTSLSLTGCGAQDDRPHPPQEAASGAAFPAGNAQPGLTLSDCDRVPDPKPADDSAAGRATAVSEGIAARAACKKEVASRRDQVSADLARIRAIKEQELADQASRKISEKEWGKRVKEGGSKPVHDFKY